MIKLKTEVNKSKLMRGLRKKASDKYKDAWESDYAVEKFMQGAEELFKLLRLGDVSNRRELLHKLLQSLSDNNELFTDETHDDIIDRIMQ